MFDLISEPNGRQKWDKFLSQHTVLRTGHLSEPIKSLQAEQSNLKKNRQTRGEDADERGEIHKESCVSRDGKMRVSGHFLISGK